MCKQFRICETGSENMLTGYRAFPLLFLEGVSKFMRRMEIEIFGIENGHVEEIEMR